MSDRPNILLIMSDQHSAHYLGVDRPGLHTPALDALAGEGTTFDAAYTPCPLCVPARMAFMSARRPHEIDVLENSFSLNAFVPTFAHSTAAAGYETWLIGRMHFTGPDQWHGFERHLVGDATPPFVGQSMDLGPFIYNAGTQVEALHNSGAGSTGLECFDDAVTAATVKALDDWQRRRSRQASTRPFLYVVGFYRPHSPYRAPRELFDLYDGRVTLPERGALESEPDYARRYHRTCRLDEAREADQRRALTAYHALVTATDRRVGRILEALDAIGQRDRTLVVYTSDHGDHAGEHHLWWKQSFYEGSARVPLIVRGPAVAAGQRAACPVDLLDLTATLLDVTGAEGLPMGRGRSLRPPLAGAEGWTDRPVLSELAPSSVCVASRMVRDGRWKYIHYHDHGIGDELYDLDADPGERDNRASDPTCTAVCRRLRDVVFSDGWDPDRISRRIDENRQQIAVVGRWTKAVRAEVLDHFLMHVCPDANRPE